MARVSPTQQPLLRRRHVFATPAYLAAPRGSLSPSVRPPTPRSRPVRFVSRTAAAPLRCPTPKPVRRRHLVPGEGERHAPQLPAPVAPERGLGPRQPSWTGRVHSPTPPCGRKRERICRSRRDRRVSPDPLPGCRGRVPATGDAPSFLHAAAVMLCASSGPSVGRCALLGEAGQSAPSDRLPLPLFVGCFLPAALHLRPATCTRLASFPGGSDGKKSACNA